MFTKTRQGGKAAFRRFAKLRSSGAALSVWPLLVVLPIYAQTPAPQGNDPNATRPATVQESVTVTADRGLAGINDTASSIAVLGSQQLEQVPALSLDDRLHQVAGFQLFRRTGSWTANPTTEGVSLRGLGSTAASRTLVVTDQVPLNDPFGGWIHWDEIPTLAIRGVDLIRGGSSDLYGSSAIGGVIEVQPVTPSRPHELVFDADTSGATENSATGDMLVASAGRRFSALAAGSGLSTDGYVPTAPAFRGLVDTESSVAEESGRLELRALSLPAGLSAFLRGNVLNEARGNGTPLQTNGTRLWRYVGGADLDGAATQAALRLYGARESYRQSFSAIAADRNSESLTRLQRVPTDELGLVAQASRNFAHSVTAALGFDIRDLRATDDESPVARGVITSTASISARQRETGGYIDAIWQPGPWSLSGSVRVDSFRTFDAGQTVSTSSVATPLPEIDELVASPRIGLVRRLPRGISLTGTAFRAFRGPTMNELYRTGQVGSQTTLANPSLLSERATGFELGAELERARLGRVRATWFWTEVNRPVSAVVLTQTATAQTLQRQNLGQIRSRGIMLEAQSENWHGLDLALGYQLAFATVTAFNSASPAQANLTGNWIPQVPRESVTASANYLAPRLANLHLVSSYTGMAYDDANNQFLLHPYARFDLLADRTLPHGFSIFAGAQNLLNRTIEAGRTPVLTLAAPRLVQGGVRYSFSR